MKIVYFGSPDFAVLPLQKLIEAGHEILGVVTQPDRKKGRSQELCPTPVKEFAVKNGLQVFQPEKVNLPEERDAILALGAELFVTVAFGQLLKPELLYGTKFGAINLHASLLPKYRGAAPIHYALWKGEKITGVTTMYMNEGMDTGDMIYKAEYEILPEDNTEKLYEKLAVIGAELLCKTIEDIGKGVAPRIPQDNSEASYATLLKKEHEIINWQQTAKEIFNHIRGFNSWPVAYTLCDGKRLKLWEAVAIDEKASAAAGEVLGFDNLGVKVCCGDGSVLLLQTVQPEGKGRMKAADWARGKQLTKGIQLG